jgi:hypothetical protein
MKERIQSNFLISRIACGTNFSYRFEWHMAGIALFKRVIQAKSGSVLPFRFSCIWHHLGLKVIHVAILYEVSFRLFRS